MAKINSSINLAQSEIYQNYCSPLTRLVETQKSMQEQINDPITKERSKSKREKKVYLKMNRKNHWSETWNKSNNGV